MGIRKAAFAIVLSMLLAARVAGHHHVGCVYDTAATQTVTGRIVEIVWRFPHVHIRLDAGNGATDRSAWDIETLNPQGLGHDGVRSDTLKVGDILITRSMDREGRQPAGVHAIDDSAQRKHDHVSDCRFELLVLTRCGFGSTVGAPPTPDVTADHG